MAAEAIVNPVGQRHQTGRFRLGAAYFKLLVALTLAVAFASFVRDRGQLLSNVSIWYFLVPFTLSVWRTRAGFLATVFLLTVTPSLHEQLNVLAGTGFHAWAFPGVDCCIGFLAAWACKGGLRNADEVLDRFPSGSLLLLHAWVALSAVVAVGRNIWQSASELSVRGLAYNVWLVRGISWHDDYYPLQDVFFYSTALALLFAAWAILLQDGNRLLRRLAGVVLAGAVTNVAFALWQKTTGKGWVRGELATSWVNGELVRNVSALWPDLHSLGAFMAMALILAYGFLVTRTASLSVKGAVGLAMLAAAVGLYLSGSRSTLLIVCVLLICLAFWAVLKLQGWRRVIPLIGAMFVVSVLDRILDSGYRGVSYDWFKDALKVLSPETINTALSYRPEIWSAALAMYSAFPIFGLGQGAFYRLSSNSQFSGSDALVSLGGSGAHNYFLQTFVELGPIGLGIALFITVPFFRLGRQNFQLVSSYALAGFAVGNIYAHSLLVRETLMLCAVFVGSYVWEAQTLGADKWRPPSHSTTRYAAIGLSALALTALVEVAMSFGRFPFTNGQRCIEAHPLAKDGWTQGGLRVPVPAAAARVELAVIADRPDLRRRPLDLDLSVVSGGGASLLTQRYTFMQRSAEERSIELLMPESPDSKRFLELKPSHCFVPLNLGLTYDPRRLGVRVKEVHFLTEAGHEAK